MENSIYKPDYVFIGGENAPKIAVNADREDLLAIAKAWHDVIEQYPHYASVVGLSKVASTVNNARNLCLPEHRNNNDEFLDNAVIIACNTVITKTGVIIDLECAQPINNEDTVFVLEKKLEANPYMPCEVLLVALPCSYYPEPYLNIVEQILEILSAGMNPWPEDINMYELLLDIEDNSRLSVEIERVFGIYLSEEEITAKNNIRNLAETIYFRTVFGS